MLANSESEPRQQVCVAVCRIFDIVRLHRSVDSDRTRGISGRHDISCRPPGPKVPRDE